ncbi:peptidase M55 [Rhodobacteraceae bacterium RKSG542]|uniref:M55 family metallopeptidase n=1 Tax=Pseudovibrio flavus TaxID=2529854 RepID=UPI0012BC4E8F|nr:M55 family metallopeptidase [Pseudovibrio flavus]MTI18695.1 peptidase M55 [Pseudovibrio flavus]
MRIFISVDIEGVAGVCEVEQGRRGNAEYEAARRLMTEEANAAIRGAFAGGATEVVVADSHGPMHNMLSEQLDPRASVINGSGRALSMIHGIDKTFDGAILIGYHASADHIGVLAHTISGGAFRRIEFNGVQMGETALFAGHAAEIGVPLLAVSGDDQLAAETKVQFPEAECIVVKKAIGAVSAHSLSPTNARKLIEEKVTEAVASAKTGKAAVPTPAPLDVTVHLNKQVLADIACFVPTVERAGAQAVRYQAASYKEAIAVLLAFMWMSAGALK